MAASEGASFIVVLPPGSAWTGTKTNNFIVMGSGTAQLHGRTTLPELMLQVP
jgi:hypothetical protein